jgi:hypothetical protein
MELIACGERNQQVVADGLPALGHDPVILKGGMSAKDRGRPWKR